MEIPTLALRKEEHEKILFALSSLLSRFGAEALFLVSRDGQPIASAGEAGVDDPQPLASLCAGSVAATGALAHILGEDEFACMHHYGRKRNIQVASLGENVILLVLLQKGKSAVGESALRRAGMILEGIIKKGRARDRVATPG
ncbi:MAG: roadblock/LC7 domain-containing protein [Acidobacteria bacterium]|nr:roadblock/LC7 domain-containing protein [Acidobacteriota bacterium]